jgi:hypothetical protein
MKFEEFKKRVYEYRLEFYRRTKNFKAFILLPYRDKASKPFDECKDTITYDISIKLGDSAESIDIALEEFRRKVMQDMQERRQTRGDVLDAIKKINDCESPNDLDLGIVYNVIKNTPAIYDFYRDAKGRKINAEEMFQQWDKYLYVYDRLKI